MGKALQQFVTVRYENGHAQADAVIRKFNVHAYPTLLVLGPDGAEWAELGAGAPADFVKELAEIRAGKDALPALRARVLEHPEDAKAALDLAGYLSNRYPDETIALCAKFAAGPKSADEEVNAEFLFLRGYAESNRGKNETALALWERVLEEFPATEAAQDAASMSTNVLPLLPAERGLAFLQRALELVETEQRAELEYTRGFLYMRAAQAEWLRRGEAAGEDPERLNNAAWECFLRGWHTDRATQWARKAVRLSERAPHILDTLASLLFRAGKLDEAIRLETEALAKVEEDAMRTEFEENLIKWQAVKTLREARKRAR